MVRTCDWRVLTNTGGTANRPSLRRKQMSKAFIFVGTLGFSVSMFALIPEGKWLYLGLLVVSTALIAFGATDEETSK